MTKDNSTVLRWRGLAALSPVFAALALSACSTSGDAIVASLRSGVYPGGDADAFPLDPAFRYIRTTRGRHVGFAWLGHTERTPQGPVEVYYSSGGEVLKIGAGRIISAAGFPTEWRRVLTPRSSWAAIAAKGDPVPITRMRDVMPGYRFGVQDDLVVRVIPPPQNSALRGVNPESLTWFEERTAESAGETVRRTVLGVDGADTWLPAARYAVDLGAGEQVVYAEQCLAADLCFTWQRWSSAMQATRKRAP